MRSILFLQYRALVVLLGLALSAGAAAGRQVGPSRFTGSVYRFTFDVRPADSLVRLGHQFILSGSEIVRLDGRILVPERDYRLDGRSGTIRLALALLDTLAADSSRPHRVEGTYHALPFSFLPEYRRREPVFLADTLARGNGTRAPVRPETPFAFDDIFGSKLQKSGSIVRGFSIGSNRDLSLNSGFRMQMAGKVSDDLELTAALTDENSPIQPEGTTQTLQEFDKVFVELRGTNLQATFGDFVLDMPGTEFSRFSRKLQGAKASAHLSAGTESGDVAVAAAVTRGKFTTNEFRGLDGVQGPYRLAGRDNERNIVIIAGTERVYLNGERVTRGENQEYVIDYSTGELTFTPRRLISHAARIVVDFEYSDRQFNRTLVGAQAGFAMLGKTLTLHTSYFRESDDPDSPLDNSLTDADRDTLRLAGDDPSKATRVGAVDVGPGKGQYLQRDTLVQDPASNQIVLRTIYVYAPYDSANARFSVTFSSVGFGIGDYEKISSGNYRFVGIRRGSYAPVRTLPMAQSHSLADVGLSGRLAEDLTLSGEFAASAFDKNRFSSLQDDDNGGTALNVGLRYAPEHMTLGKADLGSIDLTLRERQIGSRFAPLDRVNEVEFARKWNLADSSGADETIREANLAYSPGAAVTFQGGAGRIERTGTFSSNRYNASAALHASGLPAAGYQWELIDSRDPVRDGGGLWIRHGGTAKMKAGFLVPSIEYRGEVLRSRSLSADTLTFGSFQFNEVTPGIAFDSLGPVSGRAGLGMRWDDSLQTGTLRRVSRTTTQSYGLRLDSWRDLSSSLDLSVQHRTFTDAFRKRNADDRESILMRWMTRFTPLDRGVETEWFYEGASEQSAKQERIFQRVQRGTGNYVYAGDLNKNNTVDEQDFRLTRFDGDFIAVTVPTDALTPVVNVNASSRIRLTPSRMLSGGGWAASALSALTSETYARVEERSSDPDTRQIYLLHLSRFLSDATTLAGSNLLTQDMYVLENHREFSLRFRLNQRHGLAQFAALSERAFSRERSVRLRWQFLSEIANQIDFVEKIDNLTSSQPSVRERTVRSNMVSSDWSYRPVQEVEAGFRLDAGYATNAETTEANINAEAVRCVYSIQGRGQVRAELTREEVTLRRAPDVLPYELTAGRVSGRTWLWRFGLEYRLTQFIQAFASYDGRSEGGGTPVHTARAEVRAFF